jgi:RNA polymerase sigma factor (sigma-70 family)
VTGPSGAQLVAGIVAGDPAAEDALVRSFMPPLRVMLRARTRDASAVPDLVQDVLLAVLRAVRAGALRDPEKLTPFVHGVARNVANSYVRDRLNRRREEPLMEEPLGLAAEDPVESAERARFLGLALAEIGDTDREILRFTLVEGEKPGAIAARLRLTPDVVRQRKSRAIKQVAAMVARLSSSPGPTLPPHDASPAFGRS